MTVKKETAVPGEDTAVGNKQYTYHFTEVGNTQRMLARYGKDIRWCAARGYMVWDGTKWKPDSDLDVQRYAEMTIIGMYEEASQLLDKATTETDTSKRDHLAGIAEKLTAWARASEKSSMIASMLTLAKKHSYVDISQFDSHPFLFNFSNGTMDLKTGKLRKHSREDYLTQGVPYAYNPQAQAPTFKQFFEDIMLQRPELMKFVQKSLGLAMTGDVSEQAWFLLLGIGENGKSTLLETVSMCLGDYADTMNDKTVSVASRGGGDGSSPSPDIARLKGKRLITVSETEDGAKLATQLIKRMTGGDKETARFLNKDPFTFSYTHKLFIYTNHELVVRETGHGFWRRVRRVPFDYVVPKNRKDPNLRDKLEQEIEGILVWLVEGAKLWASEGLGMPEIIQEATDAYREEQDILAQFIRDTCTVGPNEKVLASAAFKAFIKWQEDEMNMHTVSAQAFKRMMLDHGYKYARSGSKGERYYHGITLQGTTSSQNSSVRLPYTQQNGHTNGHLKASTLDTLDLELEGIEGL